MAEWLGGIGNKAQLRPAKPEAGAWPELGNINIEMWQFHTIIRKIEIYLQKILIYIIRAGYNSITQVL